MTDDFKHEYDPDSLILVSPRDRDFSMYVTPRYRHHYEGQSYERLSANLLAGVLNRAKLFVDVGAHYGFFTLLAATRHPQLEILAFEPVPETAEVLRRNVALHNLQNATIHQMAVSSTGGFSAMYISLASDNCSFYAHPAAPPLRQVNVPTITLDAVLADKTPGPTVVKIDTEGHELAVLAGMPDTLKRFPDLSLLIEFNPKMQRAAGRQPEELLQELDRLGFATFLLDDRQGLPFRLTPKADWTRFMPPQGYANLYCVRNDRALSVCFFSHSAGLAGAERSLLELVTDLVHNEGTVCSVVVPADGPLVTALTQAGAACLVSSYGWWCDWRCDVSSAIPAPDALERLRPDLENLLCKTLPILARVNPDVIQTQTMVIPWGAVAAALLDKPHVWSVHESDEYLKFFAPFEKILQDIINCSAFIYTCSDTLGAALFPTLKVAKRRTRYPHIYLPDATRSAKTSGCFTRSGAVHLGIFGTLQKGKGQEDAIRALALLVERGRDVELLLAGWPNPDYRADLQVLIDAHGLADRVRIPGFLADPFPAMRETDIVLACSRDEALGRTVVEGMLLGKPVICTAIGGFLETMVDGRTGLFYPPGDAVALAARIETVLDNPRQAAAMGAAARTHAAGHFNQSTVGRDVFPTFQSLRRQPPALTSMPATLQVMVHQVILDRLATLNANTVTVALNQSVADCEQLRQVLFKETQQNKWLTRAVESAQQWQRRSWFKRAFHRRRPSGTPRNKAGLLRRWERSFRKRRRQIEILRRWEQSLQKFRKQIVSPQHPIEHVAQSNGFMPSDRFSDVKTPFAPSVTIIVLNYNHEPFLRQRLNSIYSQSYKNFNVILMDDYSQDSSVKILNEYKNRFPNITEVAQNKCNSGAPFHQWENGIQRAKGDLVWIAEGDDYCDKDFLEKLVPFFRDEAVKLAYCKTTFVNTDGKPLDFTFDEYVSRLSATKWKKNYVETAHNEVTQALGIKNTIPNASSALFRRPLFLPLLDDPDWQMMRICGDWVFYLHLIRGGKIAFSTNTTNYYRYHFSNASSASNHKNPFYYKEHETAAKAVARLYKVSDDTLEKNHAFLAEYWKQTFKKTRLPEWSLADVYDINDVKAQKLKRLPNILVACHDFATGGGEMFPIRLAAALQQEGYGVTFFDFNGVPANPEFRKNLPADMPVIQRKKYLTDVVSLMNDYGFEVVNTHHGSVDVFFAEAIARMRHSNVHSNPRLVVTLHGFYELSDDILEMHGETLSQIVDHWVFTAKKNLEPFRKYGLYTHDQFSEIPLGTVIHDAAPFNRTALKIPDAAFIVCVASRAIPEKGWIQSIQAVEQARNRSGKDIHLLLIGEGPVKDDLVKSGTPDYVHLTDFQKNVSTYYAMSDLGLCVSSYKGESCPLTVIESLAVGKPVVASDCGEIKNMLTTPSGKSAGVVFPIPNGTIPMDVVAEAINHYANNPDECKKAAIWAREAALKFDIRQIARRYGELFCNVLSSENSSSHKSLRY